MKLIDLLVQELPNRGGWPEGAVTAWQSIHDGEVYFCRADGEYTEENNGGTKNYFPVSSTRGTECVITREQYEAALSASKEVIINKPGSDGWIPWRGGECPVDGDVVVDVKFRAQGQADLDGDIADNFRWEHFSNGADVVAYRLHKSEHQKPQWDGKGLPPVGCRVEALSGDKWVEATVAYTDRPEGHGGATVWKEALVFDCKTTKPFWTDEFRPIRSEADKKRDEVEKGIAHALYKDGDFDWAESLRLATFVYGAISNGGIPHIRIE